MVSDSSNDTEDVVDLDSDTDANDDQAYEPSMGSRSAHRPAVDTPKRAEAADRATRQRRESDTKDDELFDQKVLKQELPPDEFMSIATLLNRPYTTQARSDAPRQ